MRYQMVIFDWDGTLMDSVPKIVDSMQQAAQQARVEPPGERAVKDVIGLGLPEAIATLFTEAEPEQLDLIASHYSTIYRKNDAITSPLFDGAEKLLYELDRLGIQLAIATGKSRQGLDRVLGETQVGHLFKYSRCADETHSKPHPAMVTEILTEADVCPTRALVVGDSQFDMEMAMRAGVDRVAVSYGAGHPNDFAKYSPLLCIDLILDLLCLLNKK